MKVIDVLGISIWFIWLVAGMFIGVGLYLLLKAPILSFFLFLFALGLFLVFLFVLFQFSKLYRMEK